MNDEEFWKIKESEIEELLRIEKATTEVLLYEMARILQKEKTLIELKPKLTLIKGGKE